MNTQGQAVSGQGQAVNSGPAHPVDLSTLADPIKEMGDYLLRLAGFYTLDPKGLTSPDIVDRLPDLPRFTIQEVVVMLVRLDNLFSKGLASRLAVFNQLSEGLLGPLESKAVVDNLARNLLLNGGTMDHVNRLNEVLSRPALGPDQIHMVERFFDHKEDASGGQDGAGTPVAPGPATGDQGPATDFRLFITEACTLGQGERCKPPDLFQHYLKWTAAAGLVPLGKHGFLKAVRDAFPEIRKFRPPASIGKGQSSVNYLRGIGIKAAKT